VWKRTQKIAFSKYLQTHFKAKREKVWERRSQAFPPHYTPVPEQSETEWVCSYVAEFKIININKRPPSRLTSMTILAFQKPSLYAGDFDCTSTGVLV